jgi:putative transposase
MARVLEESRSGYYAWVARTKEDETCGDKELCKVMSGLREESRNSYGYRNMTLRLQGQGNKVNRKKTYRIMKERGWLVARKKKYVKTTNSLHHYPIAPNLLNRDFRANNINEKWI